MALGRELHDLRLLGAGAGRPGAGLLRRPAQLHVLRQVGLDDAHLPGVLEEVADGLDALAAAERLGGGFQRKGLEVSGGEGGDDAVVAEPPEEPRQCLPEF